MTEQLSKCSNCGTTNRLPPPTPGRKPVCGKCKAPLPDGGGPAVVTDDTFAAEVEKSPTPVLLDLWAEWCGPCHMLAPTIDQLSSEMAGRVKVAKLNIDENPGGANRFGVRSIPTLLLFKGGRVVEQRVGNAPKTELQKMLDPHVAA